MVCEDGRALAIVPEMTDEYLLSVISSFDANTIPDSVEMAQARLALLGAGLLPAVEAALAGMPGDLGTAARIEWEYRQNIRRDSPIVASLSGALGLTSNQLDDLFVAAAGL